MEMLQDLLPINTSIAQPRGQVPRTACKPNRYHGWPQEAIREFENLCANTGEGARQLSCGLCLEPFLDPVMVPQCQHTFCRECIRQVIASRDSRCPQCRLLIPPMNDIPPNRTAIQQIDIAAQEIIQKFDIAAPDSSSLSSTGPLAELKEESIPPPPEEEELLEGEGPDIDLNRFPRVRHVHDLPDVETLKGNHSLVRVANLASLRVINMMEVPQGLSELSGVPNLEDLSCRKWELDLAPLTACKLRNLVFNSAPLIPVLKGLNHLETLQAWRELTVVRECPNLRSCEATDTNLKEVSRLPKLEVLRITKADWALNYKEKSAKGCAARVGCCALGAIFWFLGCGIVCCALGGVGVVPQDKGKLYHRLRITTIKLDRLPELRELALLGVKVKGRLPKLPNLSELEVGIAPTSPPNAPVSLIPPTSFGTLQNIKQYIDAQPMALKLPSLPNLRKLTVYGVKMNRFPRLPQLEELIIRSPRFATAGLDDPNSALLDVFIHSRTACTQSWVKSVQALPSLTSLQMEDPTITTLSDLPELQELDGFKNVRVIHHLGITELDLRTSEARVQQVSDCPHLTKLTGYWALQIIENLPALEDLDIWGTAVETVRDMPNLKRIVTTPQLTHLENLPELESVDGVVLEHITVINCPKLTQEEIPM